MDVTNNSISNGKTTKTKRTYRNLNEISLQKNYLRTIKYALDYSNNNRSSANLLKIRGEKDVYIGSIYINLFESFIINKQGFFILQKKLTVKQKIGCKRFIICFIISTMRTKVITIFF